MAYLNTKGVQMKNLQNLVKLSLLAPDELIVWNRRVKGVTHQATVTRDGNIRTEDGVIHKTPSGAAKHLNSNRPVDGWISWRVKRTGIQLSELRKKL